MDHAEDTTSVDAAEEIVRLIAQAQRRLYAFVFALVRRSADADDVLQEINVVLWRKRDAYRPGTNFLAWAFEIARLQVLAHRARCARYEDPFDAALLAEIAEAARISRRCQASKSAYDSMAAYRDRLRRRAPSETQLCKQAVNSYGTWRTRVSAGFRGGV